MKQCVNSLQPSNTTYIEFYVAYTLNQGWRTIFRSCAKIFSLKHKHIIACHAHFFTAFTIIYNKNMIW